MFSGDKLRIDLRRKEVPAAKMAILEQKFDEAKINGLLMPSAISSAVTNTDELDNVGQSLKITSRLVKRTPSANARKPQTLDVPSSGKLNLLIGRRVRWRSCVVILLTITYSYPAPANRKL